MKFILHEIKLWFQKEGSEPKSYFFLPDKVNVITGDSTTGKTSIWSIIDYCLLSANVKIPNGIYEKVLWFGMRFTINGKDICIVRKTPSNGVVASEIFFDYNSFPDKPENNKEITEVKSILDLEFGITDDLKNSLGKEITNFSYRYFLLFNALTAKLIGDDTAYFDTAFFGTKEYDKALPNILDLAIGVSDMEKLKALRKLKKINTDIIVIQKQDKKNQTNTNNFNKDIFDLIGKCKQNNFMEYEHIIEDTDEAITIIQSIVENKIRTPDNTKLFSEIDDLSQKKELLQLQITDINKYKKEYNLYKKSLNKTVDSLQPIEFLHKKLSDQLVDSYETKMFIDSLESSLKEIKSNISKKIEKPLEVSGNIKEFKKQVKIIDTRIEELTKIKKKTETEYQKERQRLIVILEIKYALEQILKREPNKPIDKNLLNSLTEEKLRLEKLPYNIAQIKHVRKTELNESIQWCYNQLKSLSEYKNAKTVFDEKEMQLQLIREGELFPLNVVGSQANYMFMHLCLFLGLHKHIILIGNEYIPQFLFIDQPSIPLFNDKQDDRKKLLDAFTLLNSFIDYITNQKQSHFQILMVEHASKEYWMDNKLEYFHTVDEFINGNGLVPSVIYNS
ncbi:hypothetical protein FACS189426_11060 [Bacteroidia bacterium]|nr:hypothetical protein FACS189426_11060 [Bacteroidia bacterium]GHV71115.1 hypothetical protein FACS189420_4980 [Bacteroidia bacterium]